MASITIQVSTTVEQTAMVVSNLTDYTSEGIVAGDLTSATLKIYSDDLVTPYVIYNLSNPELLSFRDDMVVTLDLTNVFGAQALVDKYYVCQIEFNIPHISNTEGLGLFREAMAKVFEQQDLLNLESAVEVSQTLYFLNMLLDEMEVLSNGDVLSRRADFETRLNTIQRILNY
jgi:hypothetical protein